MVGCSYSPEFYSFIENVRVRNVMERIARETEEDYQKLIKLLKSFGVEVLRPKVSDNYKDYMVNGKIVAPPMTPRDYTIMLGTDFYFKSTNITRRLAENWEIWKGESWPAVPTTDKDIKNLPSFVKKEIEEWFLGYPLESPSLSKLTQFSWGQVLDHVSNNGTIVYNFVAPELHHFNSAEITRIGKDIYLGTHHYGMYDHEQIKNLSIIYPEYRWHIVDTGGHSDATYCPVKPGLIVSLQDVPSYAKTFPGWEVVYLPGQSWAKVRPFLNLKEKNGGKWWVPGEELNDEFTNFVEIWLDHWVGYVEETVFDVNILVIDEKNVVVNNYNEEVFRALEQHGVTAHIVNFRHRYFWDGGLHCITADVHREGTMKDYFPERG
jgi:hypothetical protein